LLPLFTFVLLSDSLGDDLDHGPILL